jgi:hypothetical protein
MEPLEFVAAVLPPPGNGRYCVVELSRKKEHAYVHTLEEAQPFIDRWKKTGEDIYFALGTFGDDNNRTADNVHMVKTFAIDVDCNHPKDLPDAEGNIKPKAYASAKLAAQAIMDFTETTGLSALGDPWMVASGGGVHAYWPLSEAVDVNEWKPVAEAFKRMCYQNKLDIDPTVTSDASRVLRIPATINTGIKNKKKVRAQTNVRFMSEGSVFELADIRAVVEKNLIGTQYEVSMAKPPSNVVELPGTRPTAPSASQVKLFENSVTRFKNIVVKTRAGTGCGQIAHYVEHAEQDGMEPLWRGILSWTKVCVDGEGASKWISDMHPYSEDRMRTKLAEIKGPYPCTKMDSENPGVCPSCPHWGKITNPLLFGRDMAVTTVESVVELPRVSMDEEVKKVLRPEAPRGYAYGERGGIFIQKEDEDAQGNKVMRSVLIIPYDLFPVDILSHNGEHTVHFMAIRREGVQNITMAQKAVVSQDETVKALANQNIVASFGRGNDKNLFDYVRASVEKMSNDKSPVKVPANYGWQENSTFVYAGKIYSATSAPVEVPMPGLENIVANTKPKGSIENWVTFIKMLIAKKLYGHLSVVLAGASAPFMRFTGIYGMTYHCGSTESGTGKSLALEGAASIWGHPTHYRTGKSTSPVAMQQRLGLLQSLPLVTDEITAKNRKDSEWFPEFLLDMTEGRGKERMESGANKERLNLSIWQTVAIMSSNTHVVDYLTGSRKHSSEGEMRRVLEFVMDEELSWEPHEIEVIKSLQENYGVVGHELAEFLAKNVPMLKTLVPDVVRNCYKDFNATNDERFWMAGVGTIMTAGAILGNKYLNIVDFPLNEIKEFLKGRVNVARGTVRTSKRHAEDVLNGFIQENYGKFVVVRFNSKSGASALLGDTALIDSSTTRSVVMGRVEHGVTANHVDFFIEERLLKTFCSNMSFGYADFKRQLEKQFVVSYMPKKDLMARTSGPPMRVSTMKISREISSLDEEVINPLSVAAA